MKRSFLFLLALSSAALFQNSAHAEGDDPSTLIVNENGEAVRSSPGGSLIGTINKKVRVKKVEQRGDFIRVSIDGWIREGGLSSEETVSKAPVEQSVLAVVSYEIRRLTKNETGDAPRVLVKLRVKNQGGTVIPKWSAFLVAQNGQGRELLRSVVSGGEKGLQPQEVQEYNFYWKSGEKEYDALVSESPESIKILLTGVSLGR